MVGKKKKKKRDESSEIGEMFFWKEEAVKGGRVQNEASTPSILFPTLVLWVQILSGEG
jgi:hypothetical protein